MNFSRFEALNTVLESGSLTKAAAELGCTQSAVSHAIAALEEELGFSIIYRGRSGVRLTEEGERLMPAVRNLMGSMEQLRQTASAIKGLDSGTVRMKAQVLGLFLGILSYYINLIVFSLLVSFPINSQKGKARPYLI